jgi:hypothetical protein
MEDLLMKKFSFLLVPFLALFLISCSQELSDSSPVSPDTDLNKAFTEENNDLSYAYRYLQPFYPVIYKQWDVQGGVIEVDFTNSFIQFSQMFCVVENKESSQLYYLEKVKNNTFKIELPSKGLVNDVIDVRFYGLTNSEVASKALYKGTKYPYAYLQDFRAINVLEHSAVDGNDLDVYSGEFGTMKELFAEIKKESGKSCLLFMQRPVNEHFVIPNVVDSYFNDVKLYGLF